MDWVAFDLETTGLPRSSRPVEIGARRFFADGHIEDFSMLVNPGIPVPFDVQRIHGIADADVFDAPDVAAGLERFFAFAEGAALVAHNAYFDAGILASNAERLGRPLPPLPVHDSLRMARRLIPQLWSYRLSALARTLGLASDGFHRALPDAVVVGRLVQRLLALRSRQLLGFPVVGVGYLGPLDRLEAEPPPSFRRLARPSPWRTAPGRGLECPVFLGSASPVPQGPTEG